MRKFLLLSTIFSVLVVQAQHKFLNPPKLNDADVKLTQYASDPEMPAEVLYRSYYYQIDYNGTMYIEVLSRIKVYKKDAAEEFLNVEIPLRDINGNREMLSGLKATTYNYENGKVTSTSIDKQSKYKSNDYKYVDVTKFAFANVKDGSVVEYKYKINTPFYYTIPKVMVEDAVPIRYMEYVFDVPKYLGYNINYKGTLAPTHKKTGEENIYGGEYQVYRFAYENIKAYKDEKYVYNINNFRTSIMAELNSTNFPISANNSYQSVKGGYKSYASSWEDVRKNLLKDDKFGDELKRMNAIKNVLPADIKNIEDPQEKAAAILKFVQKNYTWNKENDVYVDEGIRNLINKKIGNTAEINLLLVMLLRSENINANPIAIATRNRGLLTAYSPSVTLFNYVIAGADFGGKLMVYDATSKLSMPNILPPRAYNYYGYMMSDKDAKRIEIVPEVKSQTFLEVTAQLEVDGSFKGQFKDRDTKLYALMVSESYDKDQDAYIKEYKEQYKFPFDNIKSGLREDGDFETSFGFNADMFTDGIGGKLVFNPLLFLFRKNHDFDQKDERRSPIELLTGYDRIKKVTITLPQGYAFESVPKSKKFRTEDSSIVYNYVVTQNGNSITVESTTTIADPIYPAGFYPAFKQIFDNITNMEAQTVTVKKL